MWKAYSLVSTKAKYTLQLLGMSDERSGGNQQTVLHSEASNDEDDDPPDIDDEKLDSVAARYGFTGKAA
jgi:hypothetical protein